MKTLVHAAVAILGLCASGTGAAAPGEGERLYREGLSRDGAPIVATTAQGERVGAAEAACVRCHLRSGFGSSEGRTVVTALPPLFGDAGAVGLRAQPLGRGRADSRYTHESLARALRDGIAANGRELAAPMPRYALDDAQVEALEQYLRSLLVQEIAGVSDDEIRLATVVGPGAERADAEAMAAVLAAFFEEHNRATRGEPARRKAGSEWMHLTYRRWTLDVWRLEGSPEGWPAQLARHYERAPVFAVVGGLASPWDAVDAFCESHAIPCILPLARAPAARGGHYSIYFDAGLALEARALARHLQERAPAIVAQVYPREGPGAEAARALREALPGVALHDVVLDDGEAVSRIAALPRTAPVVLWARAGDPGVEPVLAALAQRPAPRFASATLLGGADLPAGWFLVSPYDLPADREPRMARPRAWLAAHALGGPDAVRCNALFAAMLVGEALGHLGRFLMRERLIERVEHMASRTANVSWYPRPALGSGQRHASKGAYVVELTDAGAHPIGGWIVP